MGVRCEEKNYHVSQCPALVEMSVDASSDPNIQGPVVQN